MTSYVFSRISLLESKFSSTIHYFQQLVFTAPSRQSGHDITLAMLTQKHSNWPFAVSSLFLRHRSTRKPLIQCPSSAALTAVFIQSHPRGSAVHLKDVMTTADCTSTCRPDAVIQPTEYSCWLRWNIPSRHGSLQAAVKSKTAHEAIHPYRNNRGLQPSPRPPTTTWAIRFAMNTIRSKRRAAIIQFAAACMVAGWNRCPRLLAVDRGGISFCVLIFLFNCGVHKLISDRIRPQSQCWFWQHSCRYIRPQNTRPRVGASGPGQRVRPLFYDAVGGLLNSDHTDDGSPVCIIWNWPPKSHQQSLTCAAHRFHLLSQTTNDSSWRLEFNFLRQQYIRFQQLLVHMQTVIRIRSSVISSAEQNFWRNAFIHCGNRVRKRNEIVLKKDFGHTPQRFLLCTCKTFEENNNDKSKSKKEINITSCGNDELNNRA